MAVARPPLPLWSYLPQSRRGPSPRGHSSLDWLRPNDTGCLTSRSLISSAKDLFFFFPPNEVTFAGSWRTYLLRGRHSSPALSVCAKLRPHFDQRWLASQGRPPGPLSYDAKGTRAPGKHFLLPRLATEVPAGRRAHQSGRRTGALNEQMAALLLLGFVAAGATACLNPPPLMPAAASPSVPTSSPQYGPSPARLWLPVHCTRWPEPSR